MSRAWHRPVLWRNLRHNLVAGTRLALFLPVRELDFRISAVDGVALGATSLAFWGVGSFLRTGAAGLLDSQAIVVALAQIPIVLLVCLALARLLREPRLLLAFAVLLVSTTPLFEVVSVGVRYLADSDAPAALGEAAGWLVIAWALATLLRAQRLLGAWRGWRSIAAGALLAATLGLLVWVFPRIELWSEETAPATSGVEREDIFHLQGELLDAELSRLSPERPGVEDLYFVGVAAYGLQDTFAKELGLVRQLMDQRFDTAGRSLLLINHPATLREVPVASVTNLRSVLEYLGETVNVDEDVVVLDISTHGSSDGRLAFELPPLELQPLTPSALARMLADSGIKWKVIVVSACFSGGFIEPLRDDNTLIITAADATHSSFGCEYESEITWFGKAYFDQALRRTYSFADAFEQARRSVAAWEHADGLEPSNPQIFVGKAIREKLASIERRLAARARPRQLAGSVNALR